MGASRGEVTSSESSCWGDVGPLKGESGSSVRPLFARADLELFPDLTDPASVLSTIASPLLNPDVEARGLSVLVPGILDRKARKDRVDSLVSALLNDG